MNSRKRSKEYRLRQKIRKIEQKISEVGEYENSLSNLHSDSSQSDPRSDISASDIENYGGFIFMLGFSKKKGRIVTKFPDASSNPEDILLLHQLVKSFADAPEDWKEYTVDLKGRANTYEKPLEKFELLKTEENVLTQSDNDGKENLKQQIEEDVKRCLHDAFDKMKATLNHKKTVNDTLQKSGENEVSQADNIKKTEQSKTSVSGEDATKEVQQLQSALPIKQEPANNDYAEASTSTAVQERVVTEHVDLVDTDSSSNDEIDALFARKKRTKKTMDLALKTTSNSGTVLNVPITLDNQPMFANNSGGILDLSVPVIDLSHIKTDAEFKVAVLTELSLIRKELHAIRSNQEETSNYMIGKEVVKTKITDFQTKYNITLPINDNDIFVLFNENLKSNRFIRSDVCATLRSCIDKDLVITKSYLNMLRVFITKNLAMRYTATRKSRDKENPKDQMYHLELYKCMESIMLSVRNEKKLSTSEKDLISSLSAVLSNAKSWNRTKK